MSMFSVLVGRVPPICAEGGDYKTTANTVGVEHSNQTLADPNLARNGNGNGVRTLHNLSSIANIFREITDDISFGKRDFFGGKRSCFLQYPISGDNSSALEITSSIRWNSCSSQGLVKNLSNLQGGNQSRYAAICTLKERPKLLAELDFGGRASNGPPWPSPQGQRHCGKISNL